jgi:hypothetical protein
MANKALGAWNAHDANNAAKKGLAPSSFDRYLGMGADMAGMAGGAGALGGLGKSFSDTSFNTPASSLGGKMGTLAKVGQGVMDRFGGQGQGGYGQPQYGGAQYGGGQDYGGTPPFMPQGGGMGQMGSRGMSPSQQFNPMGMSDQNNPNLSQFIGQGRREAINDQPFRRGYETKYLGSDDETPFKARMPKIGSVQPQKKAKKKQQETVN